MLVTCFFILLMKVAAGEQMDNLIPLTVGDQDERNTIKCRPERTWDGPVSFIEA